MQAIYDVPAPAKLNLFLHITARRADGYHLLQSVFMLLDWCDTLQFELRRDGLITREDLGAALPDEDLILRAARALQHATGCPNGAHIAVDKQIPAEAGMGGGSSDAASTLLALNRLWRLNLTRAELMRLARPLGADVSFFLGSGNAWVEGIGDALQPLQGGDAIPTQSFAVVKPTSGLSTPAIFSNLSPKDYFGSATISGFAADHFGFGRNDLQSTAEQLCPEVSQAVKWLGDQGLKGRMTGSGSAVFAAISQGFTLARPPGLWNVKVCQNLTTHPLAGWVSG